MADLTKDQVRQIIANAPPGTSRAGIIAGLRARGHNLEGYDSTGVAAPRPQIPPTALGATLAVMSGRTAEFLPAALGAVGGMVGKAGIGRIAGAGIGGGTGEAIKEVYRGQPLSPREIAASAASQAAQEGVGMGLANVAGKFGRGIVRKTVRFQKAPTPSVILNEFGKPFMVEGRVVEFNKAVPKGAGHAADMAVDMATHVLGPGGALLRPALRNRGVRSALASGASGLGKFVGSRGFQNFAQHFPRASLALLQLAQLAAEPDTTGQ